MCELMCKRCGQCCYYYLDGKRKKCKFLIKLKSGKTLCRVYKTRINRILDIDKNGNMIMCLERKNKQNRIKYPNCPLNRDNWKELRGNENG